MYPPGEARQRFRAAAAEFRLPYWDWARTAPPGESVLPLSVSRPEVEVDGPNGVQMMANPLFAYQFKPLNPSAFPDWPISNPCLSRVSDFCS